MHTFVSWRPVLDVARHMDYSKVVSIWRWSQGVPLAYSNCVISCHRIHMGVAHPHATDEATSRPHAQSYWGWKRRVYAMRRVKLGCELDDTHYFRHTSNSIWYKAHYQGHYFKHTSNSIWEKAHYQGHYFRHTSNSTWDKVHYQGHYFRHLQSQFATRLIMRDQSETRFIMRDQFKTKFIMRDQIRDQSETRFFMRGIISDSSFKSSLWSWPWRQQCTIFTWNSSSWWSTTLPSLVTKGWEVQKTAPDKIQIDGWGDSKTNLIMGGST